MTKGKLPFWVRLQCRFCLLNGQYENPALRCMLYRGIIPPTWTTQCGVTGCANYRPNPESSMAILLSFVG